jgi:hypothetical protein
MQSATLNRAVAELSSACRRPIALNDRNMVPVASTPHEGPIDASRMELLYGRPAPEPVRHRLFAEQLGSNNGGPRHIDAFQGLDLGRAYIPVRSHDGCVLGHVWIIDPDRTISSGGLDDLGNIATELLADSLQGVEPTRTGDEVAAIAAHSEAYRVVVIARSTPPVFDPRGQAHISLNDVLASADLPRRFGVQAGVAAASDTDGDIVGVIALGGSAAALTRDRTTEVLAALNRHWDQHPSDGHVDTCLRIAVSPRRESGQSVGTAATALKDLLRHCSELPDGTTLFAEDRESFEFLEELRGAFGDAAPLRTLRSVEPLLKTPRTRDVARTVKAYLDSDDDAQHTAQRLFIHRGTLYYRINQAQRLTGLSITGAGRLRLHLGLVLAELAGQI